jgi:hypothetical protein
LEKSIVKLSPFIPPCRTTECGFTRSAAADALVLTVVVLFDRPFDSVALDELLFSLAVQDHEALDIIVALPDTGREFHRNTESALLAQPWPMWTRLRVMSVTARASQTISAHLVNAGLKQASGRYIAIIHHQDLVYQHTYRLLIERLKDSAIAFGGVRVVTHGYGRHHWLVIDKAQAKTEVTPLAVAMDRRGTIHAFVADRTKLDLDYLTVYQPTARLALVAFLGRLAGYPGADFSLASVPLFESRIPPHLSAAGDLGRLPSLEEALKTGSHVASGTREGIRSKLDYRTIPIFLNARDLLEPLRRQIGWLLDAGYSHIYVVDNDSSNPALLDYYDKMSREIRVVQLGMNVGHTAIWDMRILEWLDITGPYVWTDPDIVPIEECPPNALEFFWSALKAYPNKTKVGFGLRIDDLPDHYRFKYKVMRWEAQFWERKLSPKLYDADIDTTFALYRPGSRYDMSGIRTGFPYLARHAPWYENSDRPSDDHVYYIRHARPGLNNWGGDRLPDGLDSAIKELRPSPRREW